MKERIKTVFDLLVLVLIQIIYILLLTPFYFLMIFIRRFIVNDKILELTNRIIDIYPFLIIIFIAIIVISGIINTIVYIFRSQRKIIENV